MNGSISAMRCTRARVPAINQPLIHVYAQRKASNLQRSYGTDGVQAKYYKVLIDSPVIRKYYFNARRLSSYNDYEDTFLINPLLLRRMIIDAKTSDNFPVKKLITSYATDIFESLDEEIEKFKGKYAELKVSHAKISLFLLLRHISWNGITTEDEFVYPERHLFPVLLNNKEEVLSITNKLHSKSERVNGVLINTEQMSQDQEHHKTTAEIYERLFKKKGL